MTSRSDIALAVATMLVCVSAGCTAHRAPERILDSARPLVEEVEGRPHARGPLQAIRFILESDRAIPGGVRVRLDRGALGRVDNAYDWDGQAGAYPIHGVSLIDLTRRVGNDGSIQSVDAAAGAPGELKLKVWRELDEQWNVVGESPALQLRAGPNHFILQPPVITQKGDYIGFFTPRNTLKIVSASSLLTGGVLNDQSGWVLAASARRNLAYTCAGDVQLCAKRDAVAVPDPEYALRVQFMIGTMRRSVGAVDHAMARETSPIAFSVIDLTKRAPADGKLQSWQIITAGAGPLRLKVWRQAARHWSVVAESRLEIAASGLNTFQLSPPLPIRAGDYLGYFVSEKTKEPRFRETAFCANDGKMYRAGDFRGGAAESEFRRDPCGDYCFRVEYAPVTQTSELVVQSDVRAGRHEYRIPVPPAIYAVGETMRVSLESAGAPFRVIAAPADVPWRPDSMIRAEYAPPPRLPARSSASAILSLLQRWPMASDVLFIAIAVAAFVVVALPRRSRWLLLFPAANVVFNLLNVFSRQVDPPAAVISAMVGMLFIPGFVVLELAFARTAASINVLSRPPLAFALSVFCWTVLAPVVFRSGMQPDIVTASFLIALLSAIGVVFVRGHQTDTLVISNRQDSVVDYSLRAALLVVIGIFTLVMAFSAQFQSLDSDTLAHLGAYRKIAQSERLVGGDPMLGPPNRTFSHYASNPWYLVAGLIVRQAQLSVSWFYVLTVGILCPLVFLAFNAVMSSLTRSNRAAVIATLVFIVSFAVELATDWRILRSTYLQFLAYPYTLTQLILFPILLAIVVDFVATGATESLLLSVAVAISVMGEHLLFVVYVPVIVCVPLLLSTFRTSRSYRRAALALCASILIAAALSGVAALLFPFAAPAKAATLAENLQTWRNSGEEVWFLSNRLFASDGTYLWKRGWRELMSLAALAVLVGFSARLFIRSMGKRGRLAGLRLDAVPEEGRMRVVMFAFAAVVVPWIVVFNPVVVPWLLAFFRSPIPVYRFISANTIFIHVVTVAWAAILLALLVESAVHRHMRAWQAVLLAGIFVIVGYPLLDGSRRATLFNSIGDRSWNPSVFDLPFDPLYRRLAELPPGTVAVSPEKAESVVAFTPDHVLAVRPFRMGDFTTAADRIHANAAILSFDVPAADMTRLLRRYGVRYVVVPEGTPEIRRFRQAQAIFRQVATADRDVVFEATG